MERMPCPGLILVVTGCMIISLVGSGGEKGETQVANIRVSTSQSRSSS